MGYNFFRHARRIDADSIGIYHDSLTKFLTLDKGGVVPDLTVEGNHNIKFGTYNAGIAGDSTGYIPITDKDGNTRKLMVQA